MDGALKALAEVVNSVTKVKAPAKATQVVTRRLKPTICPMPALQDSESPQINV